MFEKKKEEPATTKATMAMSEMTKKMLENRRIKQEEAEKEDQERLDKQNRLKNVVKECYKNYTIANATQNEERKQKLKKDRLEMKETEKRYAKHL